MRIESVAVYSDADREARFVLEADEAFRLGAAPAAQSYLNQTAILEAARAAGVDAVHPGYGFMAENADFAQEVADAGFTFIGPAPAAIRSMGDKIAARRIAEAAGVPVVPGTRDSVGSLDDAVTFTSEHGFPVLIKAGAGGGGRGIRVVERPEELAGALERAAREATTYFGRGDVYLERYFTSARHIEIQLSGDRHGAVVPWGERDCSTQRRRQKLIEESPAPGLSDSDRDGMMRAASRLAEMTDYAGVGTVEFLYAAPEKYFFLEMNTRIQVEHTVTEQLTGMDLIRESICLASGERATHPITPRGHAVEVRVNAEDPARDFAPGPGTLSEYREPGGPGIRVDSGVYQGFAIPGDYDSLISKLIALAPTRHEAIDRMLGALKGYHIRGVPTTIHLLSNILASPTFRNGRVTTDWLDSHLPEFVGQAQPSTSSNEIGGRLRTLDLEVNGRRFEVRVHERDGGSPASRAERPRSTPGVRRGATNSIVASMRGTVLAIKKQSGESVASGEAIFVIEAMKMENEIVAPRDGRLGAVRVSVGETVDTGQLLADID